MTTVNEVLGALRARGLALWSDGDREQAARALAGDDVNDAPWAMRALIAGGTWLGAGFVAAFVAALRIFEHGFMRFAAGACLLVLAVFFSRQKRSDVTTQLVFIASFTGQPLFVSGLFELGIKDSITLVLLTLLAVQVAMLVLVEQAFHRVLSTLGALSCVAALLWHHEVPASADLLSVMLAAVVTAVMVNETGLSRGSLSTARVPFQRGLIAAWMIAMLVFALYDVGTHQRKRELFFSYSMPDVVTAVLLLHVAWVVMRARRELSLPVLAPSVALTVVGAGIVAILTSKVPGIMAAMLLIVLSHLRRDGRLYGTSMVFLGVFLWRVYYNLDLTLLEKSLMVVATGTMLIVARVLMVVVVRGEPVSVVARGFQMGRQVAIMWGAVALALVVFGGSVVEKERVLLAGKRVFLELVPVDPRSLMQGDFMALRYAVARQAFNESMDKDGFLVVTPDDRGVVRFVRIDDGSALSDGELRLRYRWRKHELRLGAESFFFEEGQGEHFSSAKFGELRVDGSGNSVLVGLRDVELRPL